MQRPMIAAAAAAPAMQAPSIDYKHSLLASREDYDAMYKRSIEDPAAFWGDIAKGYHWEQPVRFRQLHQLDVISCA